MNNTSMFAQAGQNIGQSIGGGLSSLGKGVGGLLQGRADRKAEAEQAETVQKELKQYANDPVQLNFLGQKYQSQGKDNMAKMFFDAAKKASGVTAAGAENRVSGDQSPQRLREAAKEIRTAANGDASMLARATALEKRADLMQQGQAKLQPIQAGSEYAKLKNEREEPKGSEAKANTTTQTILEGGQNVIYSITTDPYTGEVITKEKIGVEPPDGKVESETGRGAWKATDKEAYQLTVEEQRNSAAEAVKYDSLLQETIELAGESGGVPVPFIGGILGTTRDFLITDVAGLGDAITIHRSRLNEVRMQNALALLPRGPASDRDVKLALDASVDPKNLEAEDRIRYVRGMKKIADAEREYMDGKLRWIEQTGDALAFGYERKVSLDGYGKRIEAFRSDNAEEVAVLEEELKLVKALDASGNREAAKDRLNYLKQQDKIGYIDLLEAQALEQNRYDTFVETNNIQFN